MVYYSSDNVYGVCSALSCSEPKQCFSHVLFHLLPKPLAMRYREAGRYGLLILMGLFYFFPGVFTYLLWPVTFFAGLGTEFARLWI